MLFNYTQIKEWKNEYLNYDNSKKTIRYISSLKDSIKQNEQLIRSIGSENRVEILKMQVEEESKIVKKFPSFDSELNKNRN